MTSFYVYIMIGLANYALFAFQGKAMWPKEKVAGLVEMLFFVLLWPAQLVFWLYVKIDNGVAWVMGKVAG